jgi:undecaprenyl-diphosphatase
LIFVIASTLALWLFLSLGEEVIEGDTGHLDASILLALRPPNAADGPMGPRWLQEFARDITALGSVGILSLLVIASTVFLLLARRYQMALLVIASTALGALASTFLKHAYDRPRPTLVPHGAYVTSSSFPSGHAMLATTVYLTLGALLARLAPTLRLKLYIMGVATLVSLAVGVSRVYLGVHWPTDVLAGWSAGAAWALATWSLAQMIHLGEGATR